MRSKPYLFLTLVILLWGMNYVIARVLSGLNPLRVSGILYAFFRYALGALTMVLVLAYQKSTFSRIRAHIRPYQLPLLLSAFFSAIFVLATHMSLEYISSGTTSIIINLFPIIVLLFGVLYMDEDLTLLKIVGFAIGSLAGIVFLSTVWTQSASLEIGILFAVIGMLAWAAYTITLYYLDGADKYVVMTIKHIISSVMVIPFILLFIIEGGTLIFVVDALSIAGLLFAGVLASGLAYVLYFASIEIIGASKASSFLFLAPFVSLAGDFFLGEPPEVLALLAGILAIVGVALVKSSDMLEKTEES